MVAVGGNLAEGDLTPRIHRRTRSGRSEEVGGEGGSSGPPPILLLTMPPHSVVLVHGAGSGPWVFDGWASLLPGADVVAPDLQEGLDPGSASMADYAGKVASAAEGLPRPLVLIGWSMGGLVAMMAAADVAPDAIVLVEPSPPAETQGANPDPPRSPETFDPEDAYGPFPAGIRMRLESSLARSERKRGISVASLPCPALVVFGREFPEERGRAIAPRYGCSSLQFDYLDHWGLVLATEVRSAVAAACGFA
jgi:pimeloyl-ACP methyl ester carboxylesterase